jgi:hypothetical protein
MPCAAQTSGWLRRLVSRPVWLLPWLTYVVKYDNRHQMAYVRAISWLKAAQNDFAEFPLEV